MVLVKSWQIAPFVGVIVAPERPELESKITSSSFVGTFPVLGEPPEVKAQWFVSSLQLPLPPTQYLFPGGAILGETEDEGEEEGEGDSEVEGEGESEDDGEGERDGDREVLALSDKLALLLGDGDKEDEADSERDDERDDD